MILDEEATRNDIQTAIESFEAESEEFGLKIISDVGGGGGWIEKVYF